MPAVNAETGICLCCHEPFGEKDKCINCFIGRHRTVKRRPLRSRSGGKRGRNSGKVSQHGKKS